jgi:hypothetical protein
MSADPTTADLICHTKAAIATLTVVEPLLKQTTRVHPATEAGEEQLSIAAETIAGGVLVAGPFARRSVFAVGAATGSRRDRSTYCPTGKRGHHPAQQSLEQTAS